MMRVLTPRWLIAAAWIAFQLYILWDPLPLQIARPVHICLALATVFLWHRRQPVLDWLLVAVAGAVLVYYLGDWHRFYERMEDVDPVLGIDKVMGVLVLAAIFEAVRRTVGWSLLGVVLAFVAYGFLGPWFPGWLAFQGFAFEGFIEFMTVATHGILGITTETSVNFVFYFILFGAVYGATGGGQLFIDASLRLVGKRPGGAAKTEIISSALFGTISGSAVANVVATGIFTIPLMKRTGFSSEEAAAHEATASTGGQLMPPVMGVAAFVMAQLLAIPYSRVALAGAIPAVAFYFALYVLVDLKARKRAIGTISPEELAAVRPILPRLQLFLPPIALIALLAADYSATTAAIYASGVALVVCLFRRDTRLTFQGLLDMVEDTAKQAAEVALPIIAIGVIIAIAIQSNLALKFSTQLISLSGGTLLGAMLMIVIGCIIMGMGLPTVAAYIIGAILFVPALTKLGIPDLAAHFFVMYFCVLSMITPPVALASYTAAGLAKADPMRTGLIAFRLSLVLFLIPFAFAFDPALLWEGDAWTIALAVASTLAATFGWAVFLEGWLGALLNGFERAAFCAASVTVIFAVTGSMVWLAGCIALALLVAWALAVRPRLLRAGAATR
jgi:TRAP transporter 4TM/12TM fusion protein